MTPEERKKIEELEKRVEHLILQQSEMMIGLEKFAKMIGKLNEDQYPLCSRCKEPMNRVLGDEYHTKEMWECIRCGESQISAK